MSNSFFNLKSETCAAGPPSFHFDFALMALLILSTIDLILTIIWLHQGLMREANPLLNFIYQNTGLIGLAVGKTVLVLPGLLLLRKYWSRLATKLALGVGILVYVYVNYLHLQGILAMFASL